LVGKANSDKVHVELLLVWALLHVKYGQVFFTMKILGQTKEKKLDLEGVGPYNKKKKKKKVHAFHILLEYINGFGIN
jgi:hypothetical protein